MQDWQQHLASTPSGGQERVDSSKDWGIALLTLLKLLTADSLSRPCCMQSPSRSCNRLSRGAETSRSGHCTYSEIERRSSARDDTVLAALPVRHVGRPHDARWRSHSSSVISAERGFRRIDGDVYAPPSGSANYRCNSTDSQASTPL
jgi:hypothetical protein